MTEQHETVKAFAALLAAADASERQALLARANMIAMSSASDEAFEAPIQNLGNYINTPIEVPPVLLEPALLVRGAILCTVGRAGKGKTQMNLNRIMKMACGRPMFDGLKIKDGTPMLAPPKPLKVLVIENEGAAGMFHRQVGIMLHAEGYLTDEDRELVKENVLIWGDGGWSGLKLDDEKMLSEVRAGIEKWEPDVVFIEPFRGLWKGEENSSTDMAVVADALSGIASDYDCGVILTHHEKKSGRGEEGEGMSAARGSTVLEGVVATMENFEVAKGGDFREVSWSKVRYGGGHALIPIRMEWQPGDWWYRHVALEEIEQTLLNILADAHPEAMTIKDIMDETGEKEHTVRKQIKGLVDAGKVKKMPNQHSGNGSTGARYRLITPDSGEDGERLDF